MAAGVVTIVNATTAKQLVGTVEAPSLPRRTLCSRELGSKDSPTARLECTVSGYESYPTYFTNFPEAPTYIGSDDVKAGDLVTLAVAVETQFPGRGSTEGTIIVENQTSASGIPYMVAGVASGGAQNLCSGFLKALTSSAPCDVSGYDRYRVTFVSTIEEGDVRVGGKGTTTRVILACTVEPSK